MLFLDVGNQSYKFFKNNAILCRCNCAQCDNSLNKAGENFHGRSGLCEIEQEKTFMGDSHNKEQNGPVLIWLRDAW